MTDAPRAPVRYVDATVEEPPPRPAFVRRLWMVFGQPGDLFRALARNPAWFPVTLFVAFVVGAAIFLLPAEAFEALWDNVPPEQRDQMPDIPAGVMRTVGAGGAALVTLISPLVFTLVTYVIFVFIRGDRATFRQHLCVNAHAGVVAAVGHVLLYPLRVRSLDVEQTLSVGSFFPFLPEGFLFEMLSAVDLFPLWSCIVAGIGLAVIDERRSATSTAMVLVGVLVVIAVIRALV